MNILLIGSGGREHAMAWKISQSSKCTNLYVAPGNSGTQLLPRTQNIDIEANDYTSLLNFATSNKVDLTVVGPEVPLVNGIVDLFEANGLKIFGPNKVCAQLEGSKQWCKDFFQKYHIPTANYQNVDNLVDAKNYLIRVGVPIVIKVDGLAAGKGVTVTHSLVEAEHTLEDIYQQNSTEKIVIEEFLEGEEISFIVLADGDSILPLASSQDHKARDDNDLGPNTGGMGAYSPAPLVDDALHHKIIEQVIQPTLRGLKQQGNHYRGFLYAGLMVDTQGNIKVLEFNCRLGDPETQPIMMRLQSDFLSHLLDGVNSCLEKTPIQWDANYALAVVMASGGYPSPSKTGFVIQGLGIDTPNCQVFHAGIAKKDEQFVTSGGRVLAICTTAPSIKEAQRRAYARVKQTHWQDCFYRNDIGFRAINR